MNNNWQTKKLGDVAILEKKQFRSKNLPYIGMEDIESGTGRYIGSLESRGMKSTSFQFSDEHILYGRLRPYLNKVLLPDFKGHCSTEIFPIKTSKELDKRFLFYWITSDYIVERINKTCTGTRMPRANMKEVLDFEISLPSLGEQKRIVKKLDEAFEKLDRAQENTEKNLQNSEALFESYLRNIFTHPGNNWEEKKLREIGQTQTGLTPKTINKKYYGDFIPFIKPADVDIFGDGSIRYDSKGLSKEGLEVGRKIEKNSVLMVCIGATIGKVGFATREISCNQQINTLTPFDKYDAKLFYYILSTQSFFNKVIKSSSQATLPIINKGKWENLSVTFPKSLIGQKAIVKKLDALSAETKKLEKIYEQKLTDLEELKKSVLKKAFTGEL